MSEAPRGDALFPLVAANRRSTAAFLRTLDDTQWTAPSLCGSWRVCDVAGHLTLPFRTSLPRIVVGMVRNAGDFDRYNDRRSRELGQLPRETLAETLERHADSRFTPPGHGPEAPLADSSIHLRDMARPLGAEASPPLTTWRHVLDFCVTPAATRAFTRKGRTDGLRLRASDQDWEWSAATGPTLDVSGPSEALAMALAGRPAALADLTGPGVEVLRSRI